MSTRLVKPPYLLRKFYHSLIWSVPTSEKTIYLTFDDGPVPEITPWVLQQLKKYNAKATFFCVGENISKHQKMFEQIKNEGHSTGNHTNNHLNGWKTSTAAYMANVAKCNELMHTNLFRPPYGRITKSQIKNLKSQYRIIMWDVLSYDFDVKVTPEQCLKNVLKNTSVGSIVLFHDSIKAQRNLFYALPNFLRHFTEHGYNFKKLGVD